VVVEGTSPGGKKEYERGEHAVLIKSIAEGDGSANSFSVCREASATANAAFQLHVRRVVLADRGEGRL